MGRTDLSPPVSCPQLQYGPWVSGWQACGRPAQARGLSRAMSALMGHAQGLGQWKQGMDVGAHGEGTAVSQAAVDGGGSEEAEKQMA